MIQVLLVGTVIRTIADVLDLGFPVVLVESMESMERGPCGIYNPQGYNNNLVCLLEPQPSDPSQQLAMALLNSDRCKGNCNARAAWKMHVSQCIASIEDCCSIGFEDPSK
jgi:hypothetical protein